MFLSEIPGKSKDPEPPATFLQFAKSNSVLCAKITRTGAIVGFVEIRGRIDGCVHELNRKFNRDATAMVQFLRNANNVTGKKHRTLADVVGFSGFLIVVRVRMRHMKAFDLPSRRDLVCDFVVLGFLGIWDLDLGIWDFRCAASR